MKGRYLLFTVCLGCIAFYGAMAADDDTAARAATRRASGTTSAPTQSRQQVKSADTAQRSQAATSRLNTATTKSTAGTTSPRTVGARTATVSDAGRANAETISSRAAISPRSGTVINVAPRPSVGATTTTRSATPQPTTSRSAISGRPASASRSAAAPARSVTTTASRARTTGGATISRAAAATNELRETIMGRDYQTCRQVYYDCMDEFCANKDAQLKRCACSSRLHEFDRVKKSLSNVEDKLLDFNQRLLTVNMDKEDADALFTATEGENAYNQTKDTSGSKKILDEISKKLNAGGSDSFNQGLSAISLSLNTDAAFDSVDSLMGVSTTSKEGVALYNAALPICREMAAEVCDDEALAIAESGYQMTIEQDCNTVAKSFETQSDQAREKIREGGALLDISRLDIHQKRNSDDILTCKKKMLAQLSETSVCGDDLEKCLDMSGRYIDPSTGQAFLTTDLVNLSSLITRPEGDQTWTSAPGNDRFVSYLNSKKKYLEPAMENCQDISDYVWDEFIEDALAQIKLAQDSKLEEVRQSCTTLTTQCLSNTAKSLADFDARALSTFGVKADKTVNDMCASVQNACTALLKTTQGEGQDEDWVGGMSEIATSKTYETILQTCREVGRACIIQACKSISGNFAMCENIQNSTNRKSIINRTSCWPEVLKCVNEAGEDAINNIFSLVKPANGNFYTELYGSGVTTDPNCYKNPVSSTEICVHDICQTECSNPESFECRNCRIAEKIWGNCEAEPIAPIDKKDNHNRILTPQNSNSSTLLSWFAKNTGTDTLSDSCRDTSCPAGYSSSLSENNDIICISNEDFDSVGNYCPAAENYTRFYPHNMIASDDKESNCCRIGPAGPSGIPGASKSSLASGKCCIGSFNRPNTTTVVYGSADNMPTNICRPETKSTPHIIVKGVSVNNITTGLVCVPNQGAGVTGDNQTESYPSGQTIKCNGRFVYVSIKGAYIDPHKSDSFMSYQTANGTCKYNSTTNKWYISEETECNPPPVNWMINLDVTPPEPPQE